MNLVGKTLLKGHTLLFEGEAIGQSWHKNGPGSGKCSCGEMSPELPTRAARKRWHREHKEAIRKSQVQPVAPEPES